MAKENHKMKFIETIILYSRNNKHLPSCQICVNERTTASASSSS